MKNMELLNICYKYFNRFINANELIIELDKQKETEVKNMIKDIKKIIKENPNCVDDFIKKRKESLKKMIDMHEKFNSKDEKVIKVINKMKRDYEREEDCLDRWTKITEYITNNEYFNNSFESLTDYELLMFIGQNIKAPFPPHFDQDTIDKLIKVGIEKDERELLWRLAFNYEGKGLKFDKIVDYFIKNNDDFYLSELISAVGNDLDIDYIVDKVNDKEMILGLKESEPVIRDYFTDEQYDKLMSKLK